MKQSKLHILLKIAMIAAIYTALSMLLSPISFGPLQVRVAEALTLLPVLSLMPVWGLTLGCALTNFLGALSGVNILGFWDVLFGTLATLIAALLSYHFRNVRIKGIPWLSALFPIVLNGVIVGGELAFLLDSSLKGFLLFALYVAVGEAISVIVLGLPILRKLEKGKFAQFFN